MIPQRYILEWKSVASKSKKARSRTMAEARKIRKLIFIAERPPLPPIALLK
ncbi:hypothetical protein NLB58_09395 [Porphyromonas gingivalis]|uniref:hypothetical protein n=1 Tax=Porphyromonas gingivalis TaxID=837 RepID=UPI0026583861|nr:hypothetical protein [Porphyromonas gingivalis]MDP0532043.1 hypothetical protein [Porphyromonas gingivalis]MDP0625273.1 hypothetical protein [Porphyromonas gingivalis]WKD53419.1 hypothetical protein NF669_03810 [Porphyromonas gingivalis]WKD55470.1 hypothetical protein NF668_03815 [Porphyromonas gingivalis]